MLHVWARVQNFNRFGNFGLSIAPKCVSRPGSARTRWGSYSALQSTYSRYIGEGYGKANERFANNEGGEWGYGISEG